MECGDNLQDLWSRSWSWLWSWLGPNMNIWWARKASLEKLSPIEYGDVKRRNESEKCLATHNRGFNNYNHD